MADTKISDLPTDITTLADGDKFAVADISALTADTFATALEIKTYTLSGLTTASVSASTNKNYVTDAQLVIVGNTSGVNTGDQTLPVKASGAEIDTGTDDAKFATPKALKDSHNVPSVAPGTSGNLCTSNGTDWTSAAPVVQSSTSGVATSPTSTTTTTVTHGLGRTPVKIRIYGMSQFTSNSSATPTPFSIGTYTSSGNTCIYQAYNTAAITTTQAAATSTAFAVNIQTANNAFVTGVIQNVGATTFDIAWTETGTSAAKVFMWEAE